MEPHDRAELCTVKRDTGKVFVDQNAHRAIKSPLAPLFRAVEEIHPAFNYPYFDIVTDRNNLRKLLRWAKATGQCMGIANDFTIDIDCVGQRKKTLLFVRVEPKTVRKANGYGHGYEKAATTPSDSCGMRATGHHRIISIAYGKLKVLLRFEVDACVSPSVGRRTDQSTTSSNFAYDLGSLKAALIRRSILPGLTVVRTAASMIPQSSLIEIKTLTRNKPIDWSRVFPQVYIAQTPHLYVARHDDGAFQTIEKLDLTGERLSKYSAKIEAPMGKLKVFLDELLKVTSQYDATSYRLICHHGTLKLYRRPKDVGQAVGDDILSRFL